MFFLMTGVVQPSCPQEPTAPAWASWPRAARTAAGSRRTQEKSELESGSRKGAFPVQVHCRTQLRVRLGCSSGPNFKGDGGGWCRTGKPDQPLVARVADVYRIGMDTPLSGSHLGPHCKRITRSVQKGRLKRSSLFLVHALQSRLLSHQLQTRADAFDDELKYVSTGPESTFKGCQGWREL